MSREIVTFDTEDDSKGNVKLLNFYDGREHKTFYHPLGAREWLKGLKEPNLVWCVNLEYDMMNLFKDDLDTFPKRIWFGKSRLISFMFGKQLFYDTLNHWKISVAEMGKVVGEEKLPLDLTDTEKLLARCKSDCRITRKFIVEMLKRYDKLGARPKSTLPSSSLDLFVNRFNRMNYEEIPTEDNDFVKRGYFGGRTECHYLGKIDCHKNEVEKIVYVDINSMYPSVMLYDFPYPFNPENRVDLDAFGVTEAIVEVNQDVPVLPIKHNGKLVFPNGRLQGVWTNAEIQYAQKVGGVKIKKLIRGLVYPCSLKPFDSFITELWDARKNTDDKLMRDTYKLFSNSLYGKFGQGRERRKVIPFSKYLENPEKYPSKSTPFIFDDRLVVLNEEADKYPKNSVLIWAAYVTSYARIKLHSLMLSIKEKGARLLYCDTDSVMFLGNPRLVESSKELGEFKIEHVLDAVDIKLPKFYRAFKEHEIVIERVKGVPRRVAKEFFDHNEATFEKPNKFFESMRRGVKMNEWKPVTKSLRSQYDKGVVGKDGFVRPLTIGA